MRCREQEVQILCCACSSIPSGLHGALTFADGRWSFSQSNLRDQSTRGDVRFGSYRTLWLRIPSFNYAKHWQLRSSVAKTVIHGTVYGSRREHITPMEPLKRISIRSAFSKLRIFHRDHRSHSFRSRDTWRSFLDPAFDVVEKEELYAAHAATLPRKGRSCR